MSDETILLPDLIPENQKVQHSTKTDLSFVYQRLWLFLVIPDEVAMGHQESEVKVHIHPVTAASIIHHGVLAEPSAAALKVTEEEGEAYGGCVGPNAMYVTLVSCDNFSFIIKREMVLVSGTIKAMLSGPGQFAEGETNIVNLREIPSHLLVTVCLYFQYKVFYTQDPHEIPKFPIQPSIALELLMAANFLDC